jgi:hypothetical protein
VVGRDAGTSCVVIGVTVPPHSLTLTVEENEKGAEADAPTPFLNLFRNYERARSLRLANFALR